MRVTHRIGRSAAPAAAALAAAFAFLPIVNWLPGGRSAPWYGSTLSGWLSGTAIAVGGGLVLGILARRLPWVMEHGPGRDPVARPRRHARALAAAWLLVLPLAALFAYAAIATRVFSRKPLLIDEIVQLFQARIFASGLLWWPSTGRPDLFGSMHVVDLAGKVYGQFPAGGPAMLLLGRLAGATWLVGPVSGALAVAAFLLFLRVAEPRHTVRAGAALLFAFAPFTLFMSGTYMNHVTTALWLLVAIASLAYATRGAVPRPWLALASGLGFGLAATIRPVDAFSFALPAGLWYVERTRRDRSRWPELVAAGVGVAVPLVALMWVNVHTTGAPLRFGYSVLWGPKHNLGFHEAPWGPAHTPARGVALVNLYFLRLQTYLFETPIPSLLPGILALALTRRLAPLDRYLLAASALVVGFYFAYWHDGFYLGPRFMYPLVPLLALWTARLPALVRERWGRGLAHRTTLGSYAVAAAVSLLALTPMRARQYENGLLTMRWNAERAAKVAGVRNALVLVRESWGAQLVARMWGLGISRADAEQFYRMTDACALERGIAALERSGVRDSAAARSLRPLLRDSLGVLSSPFSPDSSIGYVPGAVYTPECRERLAEDSLGFTLYPPLLLAEGGNAYARDLQARDSVLLAAYPERPVYLLKPATAREGDVPRFYRVSRDSLRRAWAVEARHQAGAG